MWFKLLGSTTIPTPTEKENDCRSRIGQLVAFRAENMKEKFCIPDMFVLDSLGALEFHQLRGTKSRPQ